MAFAEATPSLIPPILAPLLTVIVEDNKSSICEYEAETYEELRDDDAQEAEIVGA
jgi:hypothetical protein